MNCAEESDCCFVATRGDGSVLFELFEEVLDQVADLVEVSIIVPRRFAVCF